MAILKHIASKNADYSKALEYLMFEHDERTGKTIRDENGKLIMRNRFIIDGINCDAYSFDKACERVNAAYHKNQTKNEIKSHHYILSFDPRDGSECGLTVERAQELGMEFAARNFPGHQVLVCTHDEGHNKSGNIHVHMVLNSIRMKDVERQPFMERNTDCRAGYKHHVTKKYFKYLLKDVMDLCQREGLHQVDLLSPAAVRITEEEYRAQKRGQENLDKLNAEIRAAQMIPRYTTFQTQKQFLRDAITETANSSSSLEEFRQLLKEKYGIAVKEQRGVFSYLHPDRNKYIRGRSLGTDYEKEHIQEMIRKGIRKRELAVAEEEAAKVRAREEEDARKHAFAVEADDDRTLIKAGEETVTFRGVRYSTIYDPARNYYKDPVAILFVHSKLQLVTDLQTCIKAQHNAAYAEKVALSNLQKAARTVCYIQEQGIGSREELRAKKKKSEEVVTVAESNLKRTEDRIQEINEQIHYAGQYLSTRSVHKEYQKSFVKPLYRHQHEKDLARYDEAVQYFRKKGLKIPALKDLKQQKEDLLARKSVQENELRSLISYRNDVRTAAINVNWIFSEDSVRRQELQRNQRLVSQKIELPPKENAAFDSNRLSINHSENTRRLENPTPTKRHQRAAEKRHYEPSL